MSEPERITCELAVIGTGMAGMASALFAANRGLSTVQVGSSSEIMFASGCLDLLGVHPIDEKKQWNNPWEGIAALCRDIPNHPYAKARERDIREAFEEFLFFLQEAGLPYQRRENANSRVITPLGTLKNTYCVPQTMWSGVAALEKKIPCLLVDIRGLKGFSARQMAAAFQDAWPDLRTARISFPENDHTSEVYTEQMARAMDSPEKRAKLVQSVKPHIKDARSVGMPAIFGMYHTHAVVSDLESAFGTPVFEIPTMPPCISGLRLKEAFEAKIPEKGVRLLLQKQVLDVRYGPDEKFVIEIGEESPEYKVKARGIVLGSGRFLGRGLHADRHRVRETVFDLPVTQPSDRSQWHRRNFLDARGHPINRAGLEIDDTFRPLDRSGRPAFPTLFAAGSILAHQDWMRMKCGSGLAIATGFGAVNAFVKGTQGIKNDG
jgi:glycerol-3-phosphate dehydrogenase subunit B